MFSSFFFKFSIRIYYLRLSSIINFKIKFAKLVIFRKKKILQKGLGEQISMYTVQYAYHCQNPPNRAIYMLILEERGRKYFFQTGWGNTLDAKYRPLML